MISTWIVLCGTLAVMTTAWLVIDIVSMRPARIKRRITEAARRMRGDKSAKAALFREGGLDNESASLKLRWEEFVAQSGLPLDPAHVVAATFIATASGLGAGLFLAPHAVWSIPLAVCGLLGPAAYVWRARRRRIEEISRQLPEAFDAMSRAVQIGQTMSSAFQLVAAECPAPVSQEFSRCCEQQNLGLPWEAAFRDLARRVPIVELHMFVIATLVQRQCGGNPVELLESMAALIRKRARLAQRIRAVTSEGRMQAFVLTLLPIVAFLWLYLSRPDYLAPLLDRPRLLLGVAAVQLIGTIWIRRTIRVEY